MLNFDRETNTNKNSNLPNQSFPTIQLEYERIRILSEYNRSRKTIYIDDEQQDNSSLISYMQQTNSHTLKSIDPYLHYDQRYNTLRNRLHDEELAELHKFINEQLSVKTGLSKSREDKERVHESSFGHHENNYSSQS